jgi:hypothetical protein
MLKRKPAYKQGIVKIRNHPHFNYGQIVEIINETITEYKIRVAHNSLIYTIEKNNIIVSQD